MINKFFLTKNNIKTKHIQILYTMGFDKNQNGGPYSNDGFRKNPNSSHLDFIEGEHVEFVGQSEKTKNKRGIPNGSIGTILDKSTMKNKTMKTSRSELFIDFGKHGTRIVRKELLRYPDEHEDLLEEQVDNQGSNQGYQDYSKEIVRKEKNRLLNELLFVVNEDDGVSLDKIKEFNEKVNAIHMKMNDNQEKKESIKQDEINSTLENRENRKKYREWRKSFLDQKYLELQAKIHELESSPDYKHKRVLRKKLADEIEELTNKYIPTNEPLTKAEFMRSCIEKYKDPEKLYNYQKDKDIVRLKYLKNELNKVQLYLKESTKEVYKYTRFMDSSSRQYIPEVSDRTDYLKYLHYHYEGGKEYKYEDPKPSREYKVDLSLSFEKDNDIKRFQWGLNPPDVVH
jgi:hypothetical protein